MPIELNPCKACGKPPKESAGKTGNSLYYRIYCSDCQYGNCEMRIGIFLEEVKARTVKEWNAANPVGTKEGENGAQHLHQNQNAEDAAVL